MVELPSECPIKEYCQILQKRDGLDVLPKEEFLSVAEKICLGILDSESDVSVCRLLNNESCQGTPKNLADILNKVRTVRLLMESISPEP